MTTHYDPILADDGEVEAVRSFLAEAAGQLDEQLSVHEVRIVPGNTHINVVFDCVKPAGFSIRDEEIREYFSGRIQEMNPLFRCVIKVGAKLHIREAKGRMTGRTVSVSFFWGQPARRVGLSYFVSDIHKREGNRTQETFYNKTKNVECLYG